MIDISQIKIIGIDPERPPRMRKELYIDLYFKLSVKAPVDWCEEFNKLGHRLSPPVKVTPANGLIMETYVHDMNHVQEHLDKIKTRIKQCNEEYLEREHQRQLAKEARNAETSVGDAKQDRLNKIIAELIY
jgi:hypothetical protein